MKQHLTFLVSVLVLVLLFGFTSTAQGQDFDQFHATQAMNSNEVDAGHRAGIFYIPSGGIFQHEGKLYVYAGSVKSEKKDGDTTCMITTNKRFDSFRMSVEVTHCRQATDADIVYVKTMKNLLYVFVKHIDETGYTILLNIKSQKEIDNNLDKVERANGLISKSLHAN